ncbi:MAG: GNAT family N-acetyltransferase [Faecalibacterium sp.]|jgi:GNAT superfamily N-acetyltransferase|nr:GNAT family N-acetyltransferase [Faecalibacterium sp.]
MEWRILTETELDVMYGPQLGRDFGPAELRPKERTLALARRRCYRPWGVFDEGRLVAYLFIADAGATGPVLLDYFAVEPAYREHGLGAKLLHDLSEMEQRPVLIESEWPARAPDPELARRRLAFYTRCGAVRTPYYDRAFSGWFYVYILSSKEITPEDIENAGPQLDAIYHVLSTGKAEYALDYERGRFSRVDSQISHISVKES